MSWEKWVECLEYLSEPSEDVVSRKPFPGVEQLELALEPELDIPLGDLVDG